MASDENIVRASAMIEAAYVNIEQRKIEQSNSILKYWRRVVESIKSNGRNGANLGKNLASHSRVIDLKNGILLVEADHPAWIQTLKIYQKYIMTGLNRRISDVNISSLAFRLKGTDFQLQNEKKEDEIRKMNERIQNRLDQEQAVFEKFQNSEPEKEEKKEMPENLRKILDRLKNDMLTCSQ